VPSLIEQAADSYKGSYALLIGQSEYTNGWSNLESIPGELDRLEGALSQHDFSITRVENLAGRKLKTAVSKFLENYGYDEGNRLLIFYAGHGYSKPNGSRGYLVPVDAPLPDKNTKHFRQVAMTMSEILGDMRSIDAKHVMVLFDSCFSGSIFKTRGSSNPTSGIAKLIKEPVRQFFTSGSAGEEVPATSLFVPIIIDALNSSVADSNQDGYTTGSELGAYVQNSFLDYGEQTPQVGKINDYELSRGDFVFKHHNMMPTASNDVSTEVAMTDFPAWFYNPTAEHGLVAATSAETEEVAIVRALFELGEQVSTQVSAITESIQSPDGDVQSDGATSASKSIHQVQFSKAVHSKGMTNSQIFTTEADSKEHFSQTHVLTFKQGETERNYRTHSVLNEDEKPEEFYEVSSRGVSYQDFRKYLLSVGFSIKSQLVILDGRPIQTVLLNWVGQEYKEPEADSSSELYKEFLQYKAEEKAAKQQND
jgi:hypothetical protein